MFVYKCGGGGVLKLNRHSNLNNISLPLLPPNHHTHTNTRKEMSFTTKIVLQPSFVFDACRTTETSLT